jgi:hypothetical protein
VQQDTIISATRVEIRPAPKHIPCGSNCGGKSLDVRDGGAWVRVLAVGCAGSAGMSVIFEGGLPDTSPCITSHSLCSWPLACCASCALPCSLA